MIMVILVLCFVLVVCVGCFLDYGNYWTCSWGETVTLPRDKTSAVDCMFMIFTILLPIYGSSF